MSGRGKLASAVLGILFLLGLVVALGHRQYRLSQLNDKLNGAMWKDAGFAETILKIEETDKITFGEIFDLCDKSVEGRTALILELRGAYPGINDNLKENLISYLNRENGFVRATKAFYRSKMQLNSAYETYFTNGIPYISSEYYFGQIREQRTALKKAIKESEEQAEGYLEQYSASLAEEKKFSSHGA